MANRAGAWAHAMIAAAIAAGAAACDLFSTAPDLPDSATPIAARPVYAFWWELMEHCSGRTGNLATVTWFAAPEVLMHDRYYNGYWWENGNRILLAQSNVLHGPTVRHEMLHALLQDGDHPPEYFGRRCGSEVGCLDCIETTFGAAPADIERAIDVGPSVLQLSVRAEWPHPGFGLDPGQLVIVVTARNPSSQPLWVRLRTSMTFGQEIFGPTTRSAYEWTVERRYFFGPGQERRMVSDVHLCEAGTYTVRGYFSDATSEELQFEIPATSPSEGCPVDLPGWRDQRQSPTALSPAHPSTSRAIIGT